MKQIFISGLIMLFALTLYSQQKAVGEDYSLSDKGAQQLFESYKKLYNDRLYIEDGHANYHIVNDLFTGDFIIRNDFSMGRPEKLSIKDYIKYLADHFSFGVQVKFQNVKIIKETNEEGVKEITISYNKVIFGQYDGKSFLSKNFEERITFEKNTKGIWRISKIELIVPTFISVDVQLGIYHPGFAINPAEGSFNMIGFKQEGNISLSYGVNLEINITNNFSVSTGFQIANFSTTLSADQIIQDEVLSIDKDNEEYYLRADATNIEDQVKLKYFKIPVLFKYYFMPLKKVSPYVGAGINIYMNSGAESNMSGISTHEGYYPQYHVLLYDIPELGFRTDYSFSRNEEIEVENTSFSARITAGARIQLFKDKLYGMLGLFYDAGISNMISSEDYLLSSNSQEYNSLIYASPNVKANSIGLQIGLKFKIK